MKNISSAGTKAQHRTLRTHSVVLRLTTDEVFPGSQVPEQEISVVRPNRIGAVSLSQWVPLRSLKGERRCGDDD